MFSCFLKIFGNHNDKIIKKYEKIVKLINRLEDEISVLQNDELKKKTIEFKKRFNDGKSLDSILPEAFAVVREVSRRVLGLRHFDTQLIGGMVLHDGCIAEMKTGEGKTLVATLAVYLNTLTGKGVHIVTVNDYLAKRDAEWMGQIYRFLDLSVATSIGGMSDAQKKNAYAADVVYGTNHEFGFDYLRDNLKFTEEEMVLRPFNFAVIDEVDSILIDEARTPLVISDSDHDASSLYILIDDAVKNITSQDYEKDEKSRVVTLTDSGIEKIEKRLGEMEVLKTPGLYDVGNISIVYHVNCALKAHQLFTRNVEYMVRNGEVLIIDEFTGRIMDGRRYSEGLHQAIEAKEGVEVQTESQTVATISYQNLFRLYPKLSGMTGTAMTEEAEFAEIYHLNVVSIPPNKSIIRIDHEDSVYLTTEEKERAVILLIKKCVEQKQPVLVGTTSLEKSEHMSNLLKREGIYHNVLNAKQHEKEAYVIAEAGTPGTVTIATNMAGRGTDIKLGGSFDMRLAIECENINDENLLERKIDEIRDDIAIKQEIVCKAGGLFIIGTERNESRRIDNQLRGRSGRQGDPGASKYFLSLEDDLIRRFGSPNFAKTLQKVGVKKDEDLTHRWISKAIAKAQQRVEAYNFDIRKQLLRFDDVMNEQRKIIYEQRIELIAAKTIDQSTMLFMIDEAIDVAIATIAVEESGSEEDWNFEQVNILCSSVFNTYLDISLLKKEYTSSVENLHQVLKSKFISIYDNSIATYGAELVGKVCRDVALRTMDKMWRNHLIFLEHLRRGINLTAYAQKNPLNEYKFEAFNLFKKMLYDINIEVLTDVFHFNFDMVLEGYNSGIEDNGFQKLVDVLAQEQIATYRKRADIIQPNKNVNNRNALCSCGSGKRYKHCHGKFENSSLPVEKESAKKKEKAKENAPSSEKKIAASKRKTKNLQLESEKSLAKNKKQQQIDGDFDDFEHYAGEEESVLGKLDVSHIRLTQDAEKDEKYANKEPFDLLSALDDVNMSDLIDISKIGNDKIEEYLTKKDKKNKLKP